MTVKIKSHVPIPVQKNGIEFEISKPRSGHIGDLIVTSSKLIWCKGRKRRNNGVTISWEELDEFALQKSGKGKGKKGAPHQYDLFRPNKS